MKPVSLLCVLLCGALFGLGLSIATMVRPEVVLNFLLFRDFGLLLVLGGAVLVALLFYQLVPRILNKPLLEARFGAHAARLNRRTVLGAATLSMAAKIQTV